MCAQLLRWAGALRCFCVERFAFVFLDLGLHGQPTAAGAELRAHWWLGFSRTWLCDGTVRFTHRAGSVLLVCYC